jgi:hypothetical protein
MDEARIHTYLIFIPDFNLATHLAKGEACALMRLFTLGSEPQRGLLYLSMDMAVLLRLIERVPEWASKQIDEPRICHTYFIFIPDFLLATCFVKGFVRALMGLFIFEGRRQGLLFYLSVHIAVLLRLVDRVPFCELPNNGRVKIRSTYFIFNPDFIPAMRSAAGGARVLALMRPFALESKLLS